MKPDIVIQVQELTKIYKLYNAPIDRLKEAINLFSKRKYHKDFYALNCVDFEVKKGECVGILGKNGAGKSTLLKILTGVLTPSSGAVEVNGRVSALLELGAGFNPEYTGMENIYFQGNVMGYSNEEIAKKIPAILEFADIGEFINQPVKSYSSGMFARLAFSVAINVEPDILIVDEALSVGDSSFQNKCIRKMTEIMNNGATVLFVSHDTQAVNKFCTRAIWLRDGAKYMDGETQDVTNAYMSFSNYGLEISDNIGVEDNQFKISELTKQTLNGIFSLDKLAKTDGLECFGEGGARILAIGFFDDKGVITTQLTQGQNAVFICEIEAYKNLHDVGIGILLKDRLNTGILTINSYMYKQPLSLMKKGSRYITKIEFVVPKIYPQDYLVTVALSDGTQMNHNQQHWIYTATTVRIISKDFIDECLVGLYQNEVKYKYEQI